MTLDEFVAIDPPPKIMEIFMGYGFCPRLEKALEGVKFPVTCYNSTTRLHLHRHLHERTAVLQLGDGQLVFVDARTEKGVTPE